MVVPHKEGTRKPLKPLVLGELPDAVVECFLRRAGDEPVSMSSEEFVGCQTYARR